MADPILNLSELLEGDSKGYLRQNDRNLIVARLAVDPRIVANNLSTPPGSVARGEAWIISGTATGLWAGNAAKTVAIALVANPSSAAGWFSTFRTTACGSGSSLGPGRSGTWSTTGPTTSRSDR